MKYFFLICTLFISIESTAQIDQSQASTLIGHGEMVTLRFVMGQKNAKLYVVGKEAAKIDLEKDAKILQITAFDKENSSEELHFEPGHGYYTVTKPPKAYQKYSLQIVTSIKGKKENIRLKAKP